MTQTELQRFADVVAELPGWVTVDDVVVICDEREFWSDEFVGAALSVRKKEFVRKALREAKDENGKSLDFINITIIDPKTESERRVYKQLELFEVPDFVQAITYYHDMRVHADKEIRRLVKAATERFGERIQSLLPFTD